MRAKKFDKKLSLNKQTIAGLNDGLMNSVKGGVCHTDGGTCYLEECVTDFRCNTELSCEFCFLWAPSV